MTEKPCCDIVDNLKKHTLDDWDDDHGVAEAGDIVYYCEVCLDWCVKEYYDELVRAELEEALDDTRA